MIFEFYPLVFYFCCIILLAKNLIYHFPSAFLLKPTFLCIVVKTPRIWSYSLIIILLPIIFSTKAYFIWLVVLICQLHPSLSPPTYIENLTLFSCLKFFFFPLHLFKLYSSSKAISFTLFSGGLNIEMIECGQDLWIWGDSHFFD